MSTEVFRGNGMKSPVWYVAYGSNLCKSRFMAYINGSDGSKWPKARGCRDQTPPQRDITSKIPGRIYFAEQSKSWENGGVAFYDPTVKDSITLVRMYLVTADQFSDIYLQENGLESGDITDAIAGLAAGSSAICGDGWYREIWRLNDFEGYPALTFTSPVRTHKATLVAPGTKYREVISVGLKESHGLSKHEVAAYFLSFK